MITITLPVPQEKIKEETNRLLQMAREKQEEIKVLHTLIKTIRDLCKHHYDRSSVCTICGYDYD